MRLALLAKLHGADIVLPIVDGPEIRLRRITRPDAEQRLLLHSLRLDLPERLDPLQNCSVDLASA